MRDSTGFSIDKHTRFKILTICTNHGYEYLADKFPNSGIANDYSSEARNNSLLEAEAKFKLMLEALINYTKESHIDHGKYSDMKNFQVEAESKVALFNQAIGTASSLTNNFSSYNHVKLLADSSDEL